MFCHETKGALFVSAMAPIKNIINIGKRGYINKIVLWVSTLVLKFKLPDNNTIKSIAELNINS